MAISNVRVALAGLVLFASLAIAASRTHLTLGTGPPSEGSSGEAKLWARTDWPSLDGLVSEKSGTSATTPGKVDQAIAAKLGMSDGINESSIQASQQRAGGEATKAQAASTSISESSEDNPGLSASLGSLSLPTFQQKRKATAASRTSQRNQDEPEASNVATEAATISELEPARLSPVAETIKFHTVASPKSSLGLGAQEWPSVGERSKVNSQFTTQESKSIRFFSAPNSRQESSIKPDEIQEEILDQLPKASQNIPSRILTSSMEHLMKDDGDQTTSESSFHTSGTRGLSHHRTTRLSTFKSSSSSSSSSSLPYHDPEQSSGVSNSSPGRESSFPSMGDLNLHHDETASEPEQPLEHKWSHNADYDDEEQLGSHPDGSNHHESTPYKDIEVTPLREHMDETYVDASDPNDPKQVHVTKEVKSVHGPNGESYVHKESKTSNSIGNSDSHGHHHHSSSSYSFSKSSNHNHNNGHSTKSYLPRGNRKNNKKYNKRDKPSHYKPFESYQPTHRGYKRPGPQWVAYPKIPSIASMTPMMPIPPIPQLPHAHVVSNSWHNFANKSAKRYRTVTDSGVHSPMSQFNVSSFGGSLYDMNSSSFTQTRKHGRHITRRQAKRMKYEHKHNRN